MEICQNVRQNVILDIMSAVQNDAEDFSAGIGILKKKNSVHKTFCQGFTSKLARSSLTSPGTIRVVVFCSLQEVGSSHFTNQTKSCRLIIIQSV
jgi:hypothetical protein